MQCPQCSTGTIRVQNTVGYTGDGGIGTHSLICDNATCLTWFHGVGMHMRSRTKLAEKPERLEVREDLTRSFRRYVEEHANMQSTHAELLLMPTVEEWHAAEIAKGLYRPDESAPAT